MAGAADGEFSESVVLDVDGVCGLALGDGFEFAGLGKYLLVVIESEGGMGMNIQYP